MSWTDINAHYAPPHLSQLLMFTTLKLSFWSIKEKKEWKKVRELWEQASGKIVSKKNNIKI